MLTAMRHTSGVLRELSHLILPPPAEGWPPDAGPSHACHNTVDATRLILYAERHDVFTIALLDFRLMPRDRHETAKISGL